MELESRFVSSLLIFVCRKKHNILTLNRDKIENEERRKLIQLDIPDHKIASFTKQNKFLKKDYKEL